MLLARRVLTGNRVAPPNLLAVLFADHGGRESETSGCPDCEKLRREAAELKNAVAKQLGTNRSSLKIRSLVMNEFVFSLDQRPSVVCLGVLPTG